MGREHFPNIFPYFIYLLLNILTVLYNDIFDLNLLVPKNICLIFHTLELNKKVRKRIILFIRFDGSVHAS